MGKFKLLWKNYWKNTKKLVLTIIAIAWILIRELVIDRFLSLANSIIDKWISENALVNGIVNWILRDAFHISSAIAVLVILVLIIKTWLDMQKENIKIDISVNPKSIQNKEIASLQITNENGQKHLFCKANVKRFESFFVDPIKGNKWEKIETDEYGALNWYSGGVDEDGYKKIEPCGKEFVEIFEFPKDINNQIRLGAGKGKFKFKFIDSPVTINIAFYRIEIELLIKLEKESTQYYKKDWAGCIDMPNAISSYDLEIWECDDAKNWK